jgi:uncharacterized membrane protein YhaH (DUF805 family)
VPPKPFQLPTFQALLPSLPFHTLEPAAQITGIVTERELKISQALRTIGMTRSAYWTSWVVWEGMMAFALTLITIAFGAAVQIDFFLNNNFFLLFFTFFLFQLAMVSVAFVLAALIRRGSQAVLLGFAIWLLGFIIQVGTRERAMFDCSQVTSAQAGLAMMCC